MSATDHRCFSERIGVVPIRVELQVSDMDDRLRNDLWSVFYDEYLAYSVKKLPGYVSAPSWMREMCEVLYFDLWHQPIDTVPFALKNLVASLRDWYFVAQWYEVYDFTEFICSSGRMPQEVLRNRSQFRVLCNDTLERHMSAWRLIDGLMTKISDEVEREAVESSIYEAERRQLVGVRGHLREALRMLSDRQEPDYRNSVKESISAVESLAKVLAGDEKASLGQAIATIERQGVRLHGSLRQGLEKLYGYSCDEDGIRHAMIEEEHVDFADAKFMLVTCSAFVHYLLLRAEKAELSLPDLTDKP